MIITHPESSTDVDGGPLLEARLREIVLTSPDVGRLADFYEDAMCYVGAREGAAWTGRLSSRRLAIVEGPANSIDRAIFAVADAGHLDRLRHRLDRADLSFARSVAPGMADQALEVVDPDGNRLVFGVEDCSDAGTPATALPARLQHVVYASDQVPAHVAFYRDVIGFAPADFVFDEARDVTSVFLRCGEEHHSLAVFRASRRRLDHLCFDVEDWSQIRDWADRFAERRLPLKWGPGRHGPGNNLFFFVNDPDGNWLEFSAELERIEAPRAAGEWVHEERTLNSWGSAILRS